jgi:hypothetical protein
MYFADLDEMLGLAGGRQMRCQHVACVGIRFVDGVGCFTVVFALGVGYSAPTVGQRRCILAIASLSCEDALCPLNTTWCFSCLSLC